MNTLQEQFDALQELVAPLTEDLRIAELEALLLTDMPLYRFLAIEDEIAALSA